MVKLVDPQPVAIDAQIGAIAAPRVSDLGGSIVELGDQYVKQSQASASALAVNTAITKASAELTKRTQERFNQVVDKDGNPMWQSLADDVDKINQEVYTKYSGSIGDIDTASAFSQQYNVIAANNLSNGQMTARRQQIDYTKAQLTDNLQKLAAQASILNPSQLGDYESQGLSAIKSQADAGMISQVEGQALTHAFSTNLRTEAYRNLLNTDPGKVLRDMDQSAGVLGIDADQQNQIKREAAAKIRDNESRALMYQAHARAESERNVKSVIETLQTGIMKGTVNEKELLEARSKLGIDGIAQNINYQKLEQFLINQRKGELQTAASNEAIYNSIANGESLIAKQYEQKDIDNAFKAEIAAKTVNGQLPSLNTRIDTAAQYSAPVKPLQADLTGVAISSEDPSEIEAAVMGYSNLMARNQVVLEGMPKEARDTLRYAASLVTSAAMQPTEALKRARATYLNNDKNPERKALEDSWGEVQKEGKELHISKQPKAVIQALSGTADSNFVTKWIFNESDKNADPELRVRYMDVLHEKFIDSKGDLGAAKSAAAEEVQKTMGVSRVTGSERLMYMPPEKVYGDFTPEQLGASLKYTIESAKGSQIDDLGNFQVKLDPLGRTHFKDGRELPVYTVTENVNGIHMPLMSETSGPVYWYPEREDLLKAAESQVKADEAAGIKRDKQGEPRKVFAYDPVSNKPIYTEDLSKLSAKKLLQIFKVINPNISEYLKEAGKIK
jgi:hypothetical protein